MKPDLIILAEDWGAHPSSSQHLALRLAADRKILWVNSVGLRRPRLTRKDLTRLAQKLAAAGRTEAASAMSVPVSGNIEVLAPFAISWPGSGLAQAANRQLLPRAIRPRAAALGLVDPILWIAFPTGLPAAGRVGESAVVYYCADDFGALKGVDHAPVMAMERELVAKADLIIATSEHLQRRLPREKTILVPHGADVDLFSRPAPRPADLPEGRPVAGFYGLFIDRIDVSLLATAARAMTDWDFVFIGAIGEAEGGDLRGLPNVRFLGPRDHGALPGYVQHWTVSLLPFKDTAMVRAMNPLKLREYLAAGRPVVATEFPAVEAYRDTVTVVPTGGALEPAIRAAALTGDATAARRARVAAETWEARAADVADALDALAARKRRRSA